MAAMILFLFMLSGGLTELLRLLSFPETMGEASELQ
jgi:hypothetical protein